MIDETTKLILKGEFKQAYSKTALLNESELFDLIVFGAADTGSITFYGFISFLIFLGESVIFHELAATILVNPLCHIEGAYPTALFHVRRMLELDPKNVKNKKSLLFFHTIPDKLLDKEEALKVARNILNEEPNDIAARDILLQYNLDIEN